VGFGLWDSVDFSLKMKTEVRWVSPLGPCLPGSSVVAFVPPVPESAVSTSKSLVRVFPLYPLNLLYLFMFLFWPLFCRIQNLHHLYQK
jgi:hypothetical protein